MKKYRSRNKERLSLLNKRWTDKNREHIREYARTWYKKNKIAVSNSHKKSFKKHGEKWKETRHKHYIGNKNRYIERRRINAKINKLNPNVRIANALRCGLHNALKGKKIKKTFELLGCTIIDFRNYLQLKFKDGMTWENYGNIWHIDHIYPISKFDLTQEAQQKICFHYTNMQPLFVIENIKKRAKVLISKQLPLL